MLKSALGAMALSFSSIVSATLSDTSAIGSVGNFSVNYNLGRISDTSNNNPVRDVFGKLNGVIKDATDITVCNADLKFVVIPEHRKEVERFLARCGIDSVNITSMRNIEGYMLYYLQQSIGQDISLVIVDPYRGQVLVSKSLPYDSE